MRKSIIVGFAALLGGACLLLAPAQELKDPPIGTEVVFTPSILFRGDLARIAPHLELAGVGCVKLSFVGERRLDAFVDVWNEGKCETFSLGTSDPITEREASLTVREIRDEAGKGQYRITLAHGGTTGRRNIEIPMVAKETAVLTSGFTKEARRDNKTPVPIWIMAAGKGAVPTQILEDLEERAKRVEWAMVVKIALRKSEPDRVGFD